MDSKQAATSVSIAEDVLKHLAALHCARGSFIDSGNDDVYVERVAGDDLGRHLERTRKTCNVCALGACFMSLLDVTGKSYNVTRDEAKYGLDIENMEPMLRDAMGARNMALVEAAYEQGGGWIFEEPERYGASDEELADAMDFGERYESNQGRLRAIMENIIANRGIFTPGEVAIA